LIPFPTELPSVNSGRESEAAAYLVRDGEMMRLVTKTGNGESVKIDKPAYPSNINTLDSPILVS
jgi:hypothetical protein